MRMLRSCRMSVNVTKLPSGLTVVTDTMPYLETAALGVWTGVGGRDETGHLIPVAFTLKTGIYWHDHEHRIGLRYPAIIQTGDGLVHLTYTWKRQRVRHCVIDPAKLESRPIVDGAWPG